MSELAPRVHDLLELRDPHSTLRTEPAGPEIPPDWASQVLRTYPWVVVRRAPTFRVPGQTWLPVGVRGATRAQRLAAYVPQTAVVRVHTPESLPDRLAGLDQGRVLGIPALSALPAAAAVLRGFAVTWGPVGAVGYELATGAPTAHWASDLDLALRVPKPVARERARGLADALAALPVRVDALLETNRGAIALTEYAEARGQVMLRGTTGPRLVTDPWQPKAGAQ
ncbi:malonate decarboxylase holo-ACP synthase [Streptomyces sp. NBC_00996]|uniref:malonate decarboxylase holo-ACP synthase n=1 Tax=Streptomyces sp. NBC_00996 TaxID=2903710 RepID=UPI003863AB45|nr:malonate decarboxylase holo-ACP synthase [Streptomyces sp. NBC_00996]